VELRPPRPELPPDVTRDTKAFTAAIRTRLFAFLRAWSIGNDESALASLESVEAGQGTIDSAAPESVASPEAAEGELWNPARLKAARESYRIEHQGPRLDPEARNLRHTHVEPSEDRTRWRVQQMLVDPEDLNDWVLELDVDLAALARGGEPVLTLVRLGSLV
jgi:hypothetical protein